MKFTRRVCPGGDGEFLEVLYISVGFLLSVIVIPFLLLIKKNQRFWEILIFISAVPFISMAPVQTITQLQWRYIGVRFAILIAALSYGVWRLSDMLQCTNLQAQRFISAIIEKDSEALITVQSDHGYVG